MSVCEAVTAQTVFLVFTAHLPYLALAEPCVSGIAGWRQTDRRTHSDSKTGAENHREAEDTRLM